MLYVINDFDFEILYRIDFCVNVLNHMIVSKVFRFFEDSLPATVTVMLRGCWPDGRTRIMSITDV